MGVVEKLRKRPIEGAKVLATWAVALAFALLATPTRLSLAAGLPIVVLGLAIRAWAAGHLVRNEQLATSGPYAYLRDPLYLGRLFLIVGFGVIGHNWPCYALMALGLGVFFLNYMPRKLRKETQRLERAFGPAYVNYRRQVRSLIPRLSPYPERSRKRWEWNLYWQVNREQLLGLAVAGLVALMLVKPWLGIGW